MRLITGLQPVREAIKVHAANLKVLVDKDGGPQIEAIARFATDRGATVELGSRGDLDRASKGARHQGAIALAPELVLVPLDVLVEEAPAGAVIIALDEIEDPQNFGAVIRSAVALGAHAILWPEHHTAPLSPATFRASAGAVEHARLCRVSSLGNALQRFGEKGATIIGLDGNAEKTLREVPTGGEIVVLVVGAEGKGLRKPIKRFCTLAKLPMTNAIDSLNASVAAGIALYEVAHRRG